MYITVAVAVPAYDRLRGGYGVAGGITRSLQLATS
jgi:hypothetical protein